jgi:hypothetical protein
MKGSAVRVRSPAFNPESVQGAGADDADEPSGDEDDPRRSAAVLDGFAT